MIEFPNGIALEDLGAVAGHNVHFVEKSLNEEVAYILLELGAARVSDVIANLILSRLAAAGSRPVFSGEILIKYVALAVEQSEHFLVSQNVFFREIAEEVDDGLLGVRFVYFIQSGGEKLQKSVFCELSRLNDLADPSSVDFDDHRTVVIVKIGVLVVGDQLLFRERRDGEKSGGEHCDQQHGNKLD